MAWDLYAEVTRFYEQDEGNPRHRETVLKAIESGDGPTAELGRHVARRMVQHHLRTMDRLGIRYDLLPHESDILRLRFWDTAFDLLKQSGAIALTDEGKNAGCWVLPMGEKVGEEPARGRPQSLPRGQSIEDDKIIFRSNGTVTYTGKVPNLKPIPMDADPGCAKKHSSPAKSEVLVLGDGNTMGNMQVVRDGLNRSQIEFVAGRTSLLNDCFF